ncbi:MAG: glycine oxidase ThiO [Pseudomonadales bacterium]|nr:glycine oxidase ThiO [Pseudomonadales bacterium]
MSDFLIIGGGIMGMLSSYALAKKGFSIRLVESQRCGQQASWAGGGIVSPLSPWDYADSITNLTKLSQQLYPSLIEQLMSETGIDSQLYQTGLISLFGDVDERSSVNEVPARVQAWAAQHSVDLKLISSDIIETLQPGLNHRATGGIWMPQVCNVRNPRLLKALKQAISQQPLICVEENTSITEFLIEGQRVSGAASQTQRFHAEKTLITSGAWSQQLLSNVGSETPIWPIRGQMLLYKPAAPLLQRIVLSGNRYLIPRRDGHILVGSTLENVGFDNSTTEQAYTELRGYAESILPALADFPVVQQWAGLRPASPAGIPKIGAIAGYDNFYINAGHFRNGLVLAPSSVQLVVEQMLGETPSLDCGPYQL